MVFTEDADYKRTVILNNIPWGMELYKLLLLLFMKMDVRFECPEYPSSLVLTNAFLIVRC